MIQKTKKPKFKYLMLKKLIKKSLNSMVPGISEKNLHLLMTSSPELGNLLKNPKDHQSNPIENIVSKDLKGLKKEIYWTASIGIRKQKL